MESGAQEKDPDLILRVIRIWQLLEALGPKEATWFQGYGSKYNKRRELKRRQGFPNLEVRRRSQPETGQASEVEGERSTFHL